MMSKEYNKIRKDSHGIDKGLKGISRRIGMEEDFWGYFGSA
jgi:hypothetical protein